VITFNKLFDNKKSFKLIFHALKDNRIHVRSTAAECINECIKMINARYKNMLSPAYSGRNIGSIRDYDQRRDYLTLIYSEVSTALFVENNSDVNYQ